MPQSTSLAVDQTLKFPLLHDFGSLDPGVSEAETDMEIQQNLFNGLVKFDNNLNLVPDLATTVPQPADNGLTYTFQLRHDVTFSNGDKFTSKDVLYSWNRAAAMQGAYAINLSAIEGYTIVSTNTATGGTLEALLEKKDPSVTLTGLTAVDDYTVKVKLSSAAGWFLSAIALAGATGSIVDQNAVKTDFDNWWAKPETAIGTGPFKMAARVPDQSVDFVAVDTWWGSPKPTVKKVHLDILSDASAAIAKYEQGAYDIYGYGGFSNAPVADIVRIQDTPTEKDQLLIRPKVNTDVRQLQHGLRLQAAGQGTLLAGPGPERARPAPRLCAGRGQEEAGHQRVLRRRLRGGHRRPDPQGPHGLPGRRPGPAWQVRPG